MAAGRWVYIEGNEDKGSGGSPFLMWFIICVVVLSFLYGLICPDYEYYPADGSCDETDWDPVFEMEMTHTDPYCEEEYFVYEKWLFSDKVSGKIMVAAQEFGDHGGGRFKETDWHKVAPLPMVEVNFEGRLNDDILIIEPPTFFRFFNLIILRAQSCARLKVAIVLILTMYSIFFVLTFVKCSGILFPALLIKISILVCLLIISLISL